MNSLTASLSSNSICLKFGKKGSADGEFQEPIGLVFDSSGNLYIADYGNYRVRKILGGF